jgi:O-acetyl-ADP-ribose deacetylase (regulator of RNase III)
MRLLNFVAGDATAPDTHPAIIAHVCNDLGAWGRGFVLALSARWRDPEMAYRAWARGAGRPGDPVFRLGATQFVSVSPDLTVANMVGQQGLRTAGGLAPVRYEAIAAALHAVGNQALVSGASVHMPRIGCGLAGGHWDRIEPLIGRALLARDVSVTVYDLPVRSPGHRR